MSIEDYEYLVDLHDFIEHIEIYQIIKKRMSRSSREKIRPDALLKEEGIAI